MRKIRYHTQFLKDAKRESRGQYRQVVDDELPKLIELLANDSPIPVRHRDHALVGDQADYRDAMSGLT